MHFIPHSGGLIFPFLMLLMFFAFLEGLSPPAPNFSNVKPFIFLLIRAMAFIHNVVIPSLLAMICLSHSYAIDILFCPAGRR